MDDNALTEITKLIFNITKFLAQSAPKFSKSIPHLFTIFKESGEIKTLKQPLSSVLNGLLNLDSTCNEWTTSAFPTNEPTSTVSRIVTLLASLTNEHSESELDLLASPVIALLSKLTTTAPPIAKSFLRDNLLPSEEDRTQVLGKSKSLSSHLLRLSNSPSVPTLSGAISQLLFELSDSNPDTFVSNVGLGYASGYLVSQGLPLPEMNGGEAGSSSCTTSANVNPITGQRWDREEPTDLPPMTDEEKGREAERLFVLFERCDSLVASTRIQLTYITDSKQLV
jgi:hypothetical protein